MGDAEMAEHQVAGEQQNGAAMEHTENGGGAKEKLGLGTKAVFGRIIPYLVIAGGKAAEAITFYKSAFGAEEVFKTFHPKRKADQEQPLIMHAHLKCGEAEFYLADEPSEGEANVKSASTPAVIFHVETSDVDSAFSRVVGAGASVSEELSDRSWGQRYGQLLDPYGYLWGLASLPVVKDSADVVAEGTVEAGQAA